MTTIFSPCMSRCLRKLTILLSFVFFASGCSMAPVRDVAQEDKLSAGEGIVVTKIRTNIKDTTIYIHPKEGGTALAMLSPVLPPEEIRIFTIRSGEAYFSKIYLKNSFVWARPDIFKIEPGTINYIGDFVAQWEFEKEGIGVHAYTLLVDRENETIAEAKKAYGWLFDKYPYRRAVPELKR